MAEIMIVDDDVQMVELIKHIMEVEGYGVVTAHSGRECLERIVEKVPDLILLDMKVQGMDGREVLREISIVTWEGAWEKPRKMRELINFANNVGVLLIKYFY
ncbi:MAG: hypothetical protein B6U72_05250 [Candidatus Altiarchaeales archaeon ex4484_2]|nr:MAG: hypothetical protein B6U72_05250 [Candidatus Altiarchaeales archaeon ex4484_2]